MPLPHSMRPPLALVAIGLLAGSLAACRSDRVDTTGSLAISDVRTRHPIVLSEGVRTLDVFPTGPGTLDPRQAADVDAFMLEYRRYGRGVLAMDVPQSASPRLSAAADRTVAAIRQAGVLGGVPSGSFVVARYAGADSSLASPVRLSFQRMEAKVASQCGMWPRDLGAGDFTSNLNNEPSWNLGCATRSNIATQVDDPVDLVRSREAGRIDTVRRTQVIEKLRSGNDPSIQWKQDGQAKVKAEITN